MEKMSDKIELPEPREGIDYFIDVLRRYTVSLSIDVDALGEESESEICTKAIEGFRDGSLDGSSEVVFSEKIKDVKVREDGLPFNLAEWQKDKLKEMGLNENGQPLRLWEIPRPSNEKTLTDYSTGLNMGGGK